MAERTPHPIARAVAAELQNAGDAFVISDALYARVRGTLARASDAEAISISLIALAYQLLRVPAAKRVVDQILDLVSPVLAKTINGRRTLDALEQARATPAEEGASQTQRAMTKPQGGASVGLRRKRT